ncbi:MAG: hypothetical protein JNL98_28755 [Bryobacterales bacterium]|nr:hypothetical protein [Bryobacterales bacterium]
MADEHREALKRKIAEAFKSTPYPGDGGLRGSDMGEEPYLVEEEFRGKTNWTALDAEFLDTAPQGYSSALSFFSEAAFRFYLPAYLIADIDGRLERSTPAFHLWYGLDDESKDLVVHRRFYGNRTWFQYKQERFAHFGSAEAGAIVSYLQWKSETDPDERDRIQQALHSYWLGRIR